MSYAEIAKIFTLTTTATALSAELPNYAAIARYNLVGTETSQGDRKMRFYTEAHPELKDRDFSSERLLLGVINGRFEQTDHSGNTDIVLPYIELTRENYPMSELSGYTELVLDPIEAVRLYRLSAVMEGYRLKDMTQALQGMAQTQSDLLAKYRTDHIPAIVGNAFHGQSWLQYLAYTQRNR